jgi:L-malate glycosyltransferase
MKILFVVDEMEAITAGGSERQVLELMDFARASGHHVELGIFRGTAWLTSDQTQCRIRNLGLGRLASVKTASKLLRFGAEMRRDGFDVVITMFWEANLLVPPLARICGVPCAVGCRRNLNYWMSDQVAVLQQISNIFATRLLANCEAVKEVVAKRESTAVDKIDVLYNGIDVDRFRRDADVRQATRESLGLALHEVVVGNSSTFRPIKGVDIFVEAAAIVARQNADCRFLLVGDGPERSHIEAQIANHELGDRFSLVGSQVDVGPFLSAMDIAILSSRSEGFSNSLLEYMAASLPTIATDVGGNKEAIGGAGIIVSPDDPQQLAEAILLLANDAVKRHRLAVLARTRAVEMFSRPVAQQQFAAYLKNILRA